MADRADFTRSDMHRHSLDRWEHDHVFGQDIARIGEQRTLVVATITALMMVVEIASGFAFGSMALLADGLHMGSHTVALGISVFAYRYARKHAHDRRFSFGTGKVNALAGFSSGILLVVFACMMAAESVERFFNPVGIAFTQAIVVAAVGLAVNALSVLILEVEHDHEHPAGDGETHHHHADHNLRAAYLHVLADTLTSILAIVALVVGKYFGMVWMDPVMGLVGAVIVARWSWTLVRDTSRVLLDNQVPPAVDDHIRSALEQPGGDRIADLHVWAIGPGIYTAAIAIVADDPKPPDYYRDRLPATLGIVHTTIEVHRCEH